MQKDFRKRRAPYHRTITTVVQRITDMGNVMPNHARPGTLTAVARCFANSFHETSQFPRNLWTSEKNLFETFLTWGSKVLTDSHYDHYYCSIIFVVEWLLYTIAIIIIIIILKNYSKIIIRVFCPRAGPSLQAQEPRLQFFRRQVIHRKLRNQGCSFTRDWIGTVTSCCFPHPTLSLASEQTLKDLKRSQGHQHGDEESEFG